MVNLTKLINHSEQTKNEQLQYNKRYGKKQVNDGTIDDIVMRKIRSEMKVPLSICFTAYRDDEYFGKGEENLKFSGCSLNTMDMMDPK